MIFNDLNFSPSVINKSYQILISPSFVADPIRDSISKDLPDILFNELQSKEFDFQAPLPPLLFGFHSAPPLTLSAYYGSPKCFKLLMTLSSNFSPQNSPKISPTTLNTTALNKEKKSSALTSKESLNSLAEAAVIGGSIEIISLLIQNGANFSNFLITAAEWRRPEVLRWILEQIEPYPNELILLKAFKAAAKSDSAECILILSEILLKEKPTAITVKDDTGDTPLTLAKLNKHLHIYDYLSSLI